MLYKTHKAGAALGMLIAFEVMRSKGWLMPGMNDFVQLAIMYPASSWGGTAPDLDHHLGSVKEQTPFNLLVHKVLHLSHPVHRSWQTHSLLVTGGFCGLMFSLVTLGNQFFGKLNNLDWVILRLIVIGAIVGVMSHLVLDAFSTAGIHTIPGWKFRFVPKHSAFATGGLWESIVFYILLVLIGLAIMNIFCSFYNTSVFTIILNIIKG